MKKPALDSDSLNRHSPFDVGFGQFANCIDIGLGEEMGHLKIWRHGELQIWGQDADPLGEPSIVFTPEHADLLEQLAAELRASESAYAAYLAEQEAQRGARDADEEEEAWVKFATDPPLAPPALEPGKPAEITESQKKPEIVKVNGKPGPEPQQAFALG